VLAQAGLLRDALDISDTSSAEDDPAVEIKPMFGNLGAFAGGNMFAGLFGPEVGVRLDDAALGGVTRGGWGVGCGGLVDWAGSDHTGRRRPSCLT
jgi:hypothetical protein